MPLSLTRKKSDKMSIKAYKYRIYPHKATTEKLQWVLDRCRELYNAGLQDVILRLKKAYDDFFRRVKNGEQPGYPRFQGPNRYDSFTYPDGAGWKLDAKERKPDKKGIVRVNLKLTKIGTVKLH